MLCDSLHGEEIFFDLLLSSRLADWNGVGRQPEVDYKKLIYKIAPLLWPKTTELRIRVFGCVGVLVIARVANVMVPILYKIIIDDLAGSDNAPVGRCKAPIDAFLFHGRRICPGVVCGMSSSKPSLCVGGKALALPEQRGEQFRAEEVGCTLIELTTAFAVFPASLILGYTALKLLQSLQRDLRAFVWIDVEQVCSFLCLDLCGAGRQLPVS